jgi:hypothetical protein
MRTRLPWACPSPVSRPSWDTIPGLRVRAARSSGWAPEGWARAERVPDAPWGGGVGKRLRVSGDREEPRKSRGDPPNRRPQLRDGPCPGQHCEGRGWSLGMLVRSRRVLTPPTQAPSRLRRLTAESGECACVLCALAPREESGAGRRDCGKGARPFVAFVTRTRCARDVWRVVRMTIVVSVPLGPGEGAGLREKASFLWHVNVKNTCRLGLFWALSFLFLFFLRVLYLFIVYVILLRGFQ